MTKLIAILGILFVTQCSAQLSIVNLSMPDSNSRHLKACGENVIKITDLPRGIHIQMLHSPAQINGQIIRISGAEHDDGDKDTLNFFDGSKMLIGRSVFTYDSCVADLRDTVSWFNKRVFFGGKTNKGTLQSGYCHYWLALTVGEILASPEVSVTDNRFKITHLSINYRIRRACELVPAIQLPSGDLSSQLDIIGAMKKGQLIFVDNIECTSKSNPKKVYKLCSFTVEIQ